MIAPPSRVRSLKGRSTTICKQICKHRNNHKEVYKEYKISQNVSIPVIGIGGILTGDDTVEFMLAGAVAIQVGTANFLEPSKGLTILNELVDFCEKKNIEKVSSNIETVLSST